MNDRRLDVAETEQRAISLGRTDLAAALALIEADAPPNRRRRAKFTLIYRLCQDDLGFLSKVPFVLGQPVPQPTFAPPDAFGPLAALEAICFFWLSKDHDKIFDAVQNLPPSILSTQLRFVLAPKLAPVDFSQAVALLAPLPDSEKSVDVVRSVALRFKGDDFSELLAWTQTLPETWAASALVGLAADLRFKHDLARLEKLALSEPLPPGGHLLVVFGCALAEYDPDHVVARVEALAAAPEKKEIILIGAVQRMPVSETREVAGRRLESLHLETRAAVFQRSIPRLFALKPDEAIHLSMTSPEDVRPAALQTLVNEWYRTDPAGLADWISRLPDGRDRGLAEGFQLSLILRANKDKAAQDAEKAKQLHPPPTY
jgi:hypothetical protein